MSSRRKRPAWSPTSLGGTTASVSLTVDDADRWFERAVDAGTTVIRPLKDEFYGRSGKPAIRMATPGGYSDRLNQVLPRPEVSDAFPSAPRSPI